MSSLSEAFRFLVSGFDFSEVFSFFGVLDFGEKKEAGFISWRLSYLELKTISLMIHKL